MFLIYNLFENKIMLVKSHVTYYFKSYVLSLWSAAVELSVFCIPPS